jgi:hypothetical protein
MTSPVRPTSPADQAWADLAAELTPAKSLARVDTVTARAVTTITVVGVLLTGLGALGAGLPAQTGAARALAVATVITAALAVTCALAAQVLTITRGLNSANLAEVKAWYRRQVITRAYPTQAATVLLLAAAILAGATAAITLAAGRATTPTVTITQTLGHSSPRGPAATTGPGQGTITVKAAFRGLAPGQVATLALTTSGRVLARAAATPTPAGTTTITITANHISNGQTATITAHVPYQTCQATLTPSHTQPTITCHPH